MKVFLVAGARPNFMKIAPIYREAKGRSAIECKIVHTGQHYDYEMSQAFFDDFGLPRPHFFLNAGSGTHAEQTARIMTSFEVILRSEKPDLVMVVGDVNSTLACSIVAKKEWIQVAHVEAGLRSGDMKMPEEVNRIVTDSITDYFFVTEKSGAENLVREGKDKKRIFFVGNVMIDNLLFQLKKIEGNPSNTFKTQALKDQFKEYCFLTLHRPSNVDSAEKLSEIMSALEVISARYPIFFPVHPRTKKMLTKFDLKLPKGIITLEPLGFSEALNLWKDAKIVLTDSGGLQEETTALGVPCITIRENTERPITVEIGTNILAGTKYDGIIAAFEQHLTKGKLGRVPEKWDGKAAKRILDVLEEAG